MPELARHKASDSRDEIFATLSRDGGVIVEDAFAPDLVDALVADFTPHLDAADWANTEGDELPNEFFGFKTKRLHGLLARSSHFSRVVTDPLLLDMAKHFLGGRCRDFRLSTGELMVLGEGESDQTLHRDADSWMYYPPPRPELLVSGNLALTDFTERNGATRVAPGSHLWDKRRRPEPDEICQATMPRGSVLLYSGDVLHGGGANGTGEIRIGLYVGYVLSWLRSIEDHAVSNGVETVEAAPARVRELMGYEPGGFQAIA